MEQKNIEELKNEIQELNKNLKTATNWLLEATSLISRHQGFYYQSDKPLR